MKDGSPGVKCLPLLPGSSGLQTGPNGPPMSHQRPAQKPLPMPHKITASHPKYRSTNRAIWVKSAEFTGGSGAFSVSSGTRSRVWSVPWW
jgi:hypothetical protein